VNLSRLVLPLLLIGFGASSARAQDSKWYQASTEHFVLFTDTSESKAQRLLTDLEQRLAGFDDIVATVHPLPFPIEVFLFKTREDFIAAMPNRPPVNGSAPPEEDAYLLRGPDRVFILAKDKSPTDIAEDAAHYLGHVLFEHEVVWRPFWLAEGSAEYVRKLGRDPDSKAVPEKEANSVEDLLTIVPSATYDDTDRPTAFRTEAYRLLRVLLKENPQALRNYLAAIGKPEGQDAKLNVDVDDIQQKYDEYVETALSLPPVVPVVKITPADAASLGVRRGDLLLASGRTYEASRYYNGNTPEARAARSVLTSVSRPAAEAAAALARTAQELPDNGLVQYHFGAIETEDSKLAEGQTAALQRAVAMMPRSGRAAAELARVYAQGGKADQSSALLDRALELEPEYADRYFAIRAAALLALSRYEDSLRAMKTAEALPHANRKAAEAYTVKVMEMTRKVETARRTEDSQRTDRIRRDLENKVNEREPVKPPPPPEVIPEGSIDYAISAGATIEVVDTVYPDYPEALRRARKSGRIALRVEVGTDGKVRNASVTSSQVPELNAATAEAAKHWTFKLPARARPAPINVTLTFNFTLQ
jgi:TonB family protein